MKRWNKWHVVLIILSVLILFGFIGITAYLLFFNYSNVRLLKEAQSNFRRGDAKSLELAESQLLQLIENDDDNEAAFIMLGKIAEKQKSYPGLVSYTYMAHRLDPLSEENKAWYIRSLALARYFDRLENFLAQQPELPDKWNQLLLYAAGRNGNFKKYPAQLERRSNDNKVGELAFLLFEHENLTIPQMLSALELHFKSDDAFLQQEVLAAQAELYLQSGKIDDAEKALLKACEQNEFAFAPALGRFYANFRSFGNALPVFEKYLSTYHDPLVALETAEIYCLLKKTEKIAGFRTQYQDDPGNSAMLCCFYFDALIAFAKNDFAALKELLVPLRKNINTPLAAFIFFSSDLRDGNLAAIRESYTALISHRKHLDLQSRADDMLSDFLKHAVVKLPEKEAELLALATLLYQRKKEAFTAKILLLAQRKRNSVNIPMLNDALARFGNDPGVVKIAIEYHLERDLIQSGRLIGEFKKKFPGKAADMLRYEIILALRKKDFDLASKLFQENFSAGFLPEYWQFATVSGRENDLLFLSRDKLYEPFCKAFIALEKGAKTEACDLLENADAGGNPDLLFFAARTLAENGRNQAALAKYALFPEKSAYRQVVLLNKSELFAENGNLERALEEAEKAYLSAPELPEAQLCYADKLFRSGKAGKIPDVVKLSSSSPYREKMEKLWIAGMQHRIKECDFSRQREKARELCRQLLAVSPADDLALESLKKLNKMPQ